RENLWRIRPPPIGTQSTPWKESRAVNSTDPIFAHSRASGAFALAASIVYEFAVESSPQERLRHGCVRSCRFPDFLPLVSRPAGRSRAVAELDRRRGARGVRRQSATLAGLRADRRSARRAQAAGCGRDRRARPAPGGCRISDLSEDTVGPVPIAARSSWRAALRRAQDRP